MPTGAQSRIKGEKTSEKTRRGRGTTSQESSRNPPRSEAGEASHASKVFPQARPESSRDGSKAQRPGLGSQPAQSKQAAKHAASKWTRLGTAEKKLKESAEKLEGLLPLDLLSSQKREMESTTGSADINALADSLGSIIEVLMRERDIEEAPSGLSVIKVWAKKALPFVEKGLDIATVSSPFSLLREIGCGPSSVWVARFGCSFCCAGILLLFSH
jgi:hypothetical protein